MSWNRVVVAGVVVLALVVVVDAVRRDGTEDSRAADEGLLIDVSSSREGVGIAVSQLRRAFPPPRPDSLAVSKVAAAPDGVLAVALSHVSGRDRARAAIELWDNDELVSAFAVPVGSFSLGLWFADEGNVIATIGVDGRGYLYDRDGRAGRGRAYFAYETP